MTALHRLSASEAVRRLAGGTIGAEVLVSACLERAAAGAAIGAWAFLDPESALAQARAADRAGRPGRLAGLPVGFKDVIDTFDMPTEHGSPFYRGNRPFADAACVALLRMAGAVIFGKTVTSELANRHPGATRHPLDPAHTPGGSSSGSAAAVADCQVPAALGTQTAGSVIRPAAFCGVIGYKPSFGELSRVGIKGQSHTLDTLGFFCRSLEDVALLRGVLLACSHVAPDRQAGAPRIGLCRTPAWEDADAATRALVEASAARLSAAGARVRAVEFPAGFGDILAQHRRIFHFEAARNYAHEFETAGERLSAVLRETVLAPGRAMPLAEYVAAIEVAEAFRRWLDDLLGEFDLLLTPAAVGEAPLGLASTGDARFNAPWTLAGTPCLTLPAGTGPGGLPLGLQLVGARHRDEAFLDAALWVEAHLDPG